MFACFETCPFQAGMRNNKTTSKFLMAALAFFLVVFCLSMSKSLTYSKNNLKSLVIDVRLLGDAVSIVSTTARNIQHHLVLPASLTWPDAARASQPCVRTCWPDRSRIWGTASTGSPPSFSDGGRLASDDSEVFERACKMVLTVHWQVLAVINRRYAFGKI
jgi:hypothetical protein